MLDPLGGNSVLGELSIEERESYYLSLNNIGLDDEAYHKGLFNNDPERKVYEACETVIAYIQKDSGEIIPATAIQSDERLMNEPLDITLDRFYLQRYPGRSKHIVQINFSTEHNVTLPKPYKMVKIQDILYGFVVSARDRQAVPLNGVGIFRGLQIRQELQMKIATIHLLDPVEEQILNVLQSDMMRSGLDLLLSINPVVSILSELVMGTTKMFLSSHKNRAIFEAQIGLLIDTSISNPKLREGSYLIIQADMDWFNLEDYWWNPKRGKIEHKILKEDLPYNHFLISVKKSRDQNLL